jgi:putative membrane protein
MLPTLHVFSGEVSLLSWYPDPIVLFGVLAAGALYFRYTGPKRGQFQDSAPVPRARQISFYGGLAAVVIGLLSPLGVLADDYWLSAHMIQHIFLTMIIPPALLWGVPVWMVDAVVRRFPRAWSVWRYLTRPVIAFMVAHVPYALAHFPAIYDSMLTNTPVHILMHEIFFLTAFVAWWPILAPGPAYGRLAPPVQMLYFFVQTIPGQIVGAMIALSETPLYTPYVEAPRVFGLSAMTDQQIGGLIMWVMTGVVYLGLMAIVFFRWASAEDRAEAQRYASARRTG